MPPLAYFLAGFITGAIVMGVLIPLLFMRRAETEAPETVYFEDLGNYHISLENMPSVRAANANTPTSGDPSSGVGGLE